MQWPTDQPLVWQPAEPSRRRRGPDLVVTTTALTVGFVANVGVVWLALSWSAVMGDVFLWARWMLVLVQVGLWSVTAAVCILRWRRGRSGLWIAVAGGILATLFFWVSTFLLMASLPCPSMC